MSTFDKLCSLLAIPIGIVFMVLGAVGLFAGAGAHFTLPPGLGALPFFLGWAMCVVPIKLWMRTTGGATAVHGQAEEQPPAVDGTAEGERP